MAPTILRQLNVSTNCPAQKPTETADPIDQYHELSFERGKTLGLGMHKTKFIPAYRQGWTGDILLEETGPHHPFLHFTGQETSRGTGLPVEFSDGPNTGKTHNHVSRRREMVRDSTGPGMASGRWLDMKWQREKGGVGEVKIGRRGDQRPHMTPVTRREIFFRRERKTGVSEREREGVPQKTGEPTPLASAPTGEFLLVQAPRRGCLTTSAASMPSGASRLPEPTWRYPLGRGPEYWSGWPFPWPHPRRRSEILLPSGSQTECREY